MVAVSFLLKLEPVFLGLQVYNAKLYTCFSGHGTVPSIMPIELVALN